MTNLEQVIHEQQSRFHQVRYSEQGVVVKEPDKINV